MPSVARRTWVSLCLLACALLTGCGTLHLHSAAREAQGKAAKQAYDDANPLGVIKTERENTAALLAKEVGSVESATLLARDLRLAGMAVGPLNAELLNPVNDRVRAMQGDVSDNDFLTRLAAARTKEAAFQSQLTRNQRDLRRNGFEEFSCEDLTTGKADQTIAEWLAAAKTTDPILASGVSGGLQMAKAQCEKSLKDRTSVVDLVNSEMAAVAAKPSLVTEMAVLYEAERTLAQKKGTVNASDRNAYRVALLEYQRVLRAPDRNEPASPAAKPAAPPADGASAPSAPKEPVAGESKPPTKLEAALKKLQNAIAKLKTLDDKYSLKLLSEERISAIDELLVALVEPKAADDKTATRKDSVGRALARLSESYADWKAVEAEAEAVKLKPLLMQRAIDALQADALVRAIALEEAKVQLLRIRVALLERQASSYRTAAQLLCLTTAQSGAPVPCTQVSKPTATLRDTLADKAVSEPEKAKIMQAAARFGHADGYLKAQLEANSLRVAALKDSNSLTVSENNARQWDELIRGHLDLMEAWTKTGVTDEDLSRYVNAVLMFAIAWGVN